MDGYFGVLQAKARREKARKELVGKLRPIDAAFAHCGERRGQVALGDAAAVLVGDQRMMEVGRLGQAKQLLEQALDRCRSTQVGAAHDYRHVALGVVDDTGEMVGGGRVFAGEDRVADVAGLGGEGAPVGFRPRRQARKFERRPRVEPPAVRRRGPAVRIIWQGTTGTRIGSRRVAVRGSQRLGDVSAGAEAGEYQPSRPQIIERALVCSGALRLYQHRLVPLEAEPLQVLINPADELRLAPRLVEVLDPKAKLAARLSRINCSLASSKPRLSRAAWFSILPTISWGGGSAKR